VRRAKNFFENSITANGPCESSQCQDGDTLKDSLLVILDKLSTELERRLVFYREFCDRFSFLSHLLKMEPNEIQDFAKELQKHYSEDLEEIFGAKCVHLKSFRLSSGDDTCYLSLDNYFKY
jgi:hypothetical protein